MSNGTTHYYGCWKLVSPGHGSCTPEDQWEFLEAELEELKTKHKTTLLQLADSQKDFRKVTARVKELEQLGFPNVNGGGNGNGDGIPVGGSSNNVSSTTGPVVAETLLEEPRFWRVVDETSSTNRTHGERLLRRSGRGGRGK